MMDAYFILRMIKNFSPLTQDDNLYPESKCYDNTNLHNRNIVAYAGGHHTAFYLNFFIFYTKKNARICSRT